MTKNDPKNILVEPEEESFEEFLEWTPEEEEEFLRLFSEQEKGGKPEDDI